jgi:hypothetical protein
MKGKKIVAIAVHPESERIVIIGYNFKTSTAYAKVISLKGKGKIQVIDFPNEDFTEFTRNEILRYEEGGWKVFRL